jgi:hypothetical protein
MMKHGYFRQTSHAGAIRTNETEKENMKREPLKGQR